MQKDRLNTEVQALERKLRLLLAEYQKVSAENKQLKSENDRLKGILDNRDKQVADIQDKINISSIVNNINTGKNEVGEEVKEKLDNYIDEIDKCIEYLSK